MTWERIKSSMPTGSEQWNAAVQVLLWSMLAYLVTPVLWVAFGPRQWVVLNLSSASQESQWGARTTGASAGEVGILQFTPTGAATAGWPVATADRGTEKDWRTSIFWSCLAAGRYWRVALYTSWRWWLVRVPVYGAAVYRRAWRSGPASTLDGAWMAFTNEWRALNSYGALTALSLAVLLVPYALWRRR